MLGARFKAIASPTLSPARLGERDEGLFVGRFARHFTPYIVCSLYSGWQFVTRTTHDPLRSKLSLRPMDSSSRSSRPHQVKVSLLSTWSWMDWGKSRHSLERMASFSMRRLLSLSTVGRMLLCFRCLALSWLLLLSVYPCHIRYSLRGSTFLDDLQLDYDL